MKNSLFAAAALAVLAVSCGPSTRIEKSWKDPQESKTLNDMKKVLIVCFAESETSRRQAEEMLAARLQGRGVASYGYKVVAEKGADASALTDAIKADGFDAAIVTRLIDKEKETSYVPGTITYPYYAGFRGYYGYGYGAYATPGYYVQDKIYYIETNVYDLTADKLVWSAVTSTTNPGKMEKSLNEIADVLAQKMRKDGFLR
jgi:hypothetical protein